MGTTAEQVSNLTKNLNEMLAKKALLDEQIAATRNMIQGVNMGVALQKEVETEEE